MLVLLSNLNWFILVQSFFSGFIATLTGFGDAILFHLGWEIAGLLGIVERDDLIKVVTLILVFTPFAEIPIVLTTWRDVEWKAICVLIPPTVVGIAAGATILVSFQPVLLKRALGCVLVAFALWRLFIEFSIGPLVQRLTKRLFGRHVLSHVPAVEMTPIGAAELARASCDTATLLPPETLHATSLQQSHNATDTGTRASQGTSPRASQDTATSQDTAARQLQGATSRPSQDTDTRETESLASVPRASHDAAHQVLQGASLRA
eukprot:CAMPEP_0177685538 /NCGR_PEP_ID=MMETSP0447-20121125/33089_1 /TAXON_ID=0 /ORGANISM="Stygamoeba regulata, Strain BSH-02190019" /LENGTH=262 /DNA_ID=CAMNT_0019195601 /DNA_START=500 /DNA_END=1285 /DNA_ORIENTATION=+